MITYLFKKDEKGRFLIQRSGKEKWTLIPKKIKTKKQLDQWIKHKRENCI